MLSKLTQNVLEFDWHLTNRCNFLCEYCHPQIRKVLNKKHLNEPHYSLVVQRFDDLGKKCTILMSGGEPFLYPNYIDLCIGLTQQHYICMNTNLSTNNVMEFAERIDPSRVVYITAALHQTEREMRQGGISIYVENFLALQKRGFKITALYVLYPPLLDRFVDDLHIIEDAGIQSISSKVFKGVYQGRLYPDNYTEDEKEKIYKYKGDYRFNTPYLAGQMHFKGQPCIAGCQSFKIEVTGQVHRCATVKGDYGNFYDGTFSSDMKPEPCTANRVLVVSQCHRYLVNSPITPDAMGR